MSTKIFFAVFLIVGCSRATKFNGQEKGFEISRTLPENENSVSANLPTSEKSASEINGTVKPSDSSSPPVSQRLTTEPDLYAGLKIHLDSSQEELLVREPDTGRDAIRSLKNKVSSFFNASQLSVQHMPSIVTDSFGPRVIDFQRSQAQDLEIEGTPDFVSLFDPGKKWTVQFWIKPHVTTNADWLVVFDKPFTSHVSPFYQLQIFYHPEQSIIRPVITCEITCSDISAPIVRTGWSHVAWSVDLANAHFKLYVNGKLEVFSTKPLNGTYKNYGTGATIGGLKGMRTPAYNLDGMLTQFEVFDDALSPERIEKIYLIEKAKLGIK